MATINILDQNTINQIAAGEVIERPASVVKELIENAIDAQAAAITCEIKGGGIELIRVTDNGCGIEPSQIRKAFTSHATSKIKTAADLVDVMSLGFRGEALASIASVAEVEVLTKLPGEVMGTRYAICCGEERALCDAGCPEGTTIIVKQLFSNVPVRRKFLKSAITEASYVSDLVEKIALSHPEVSIKYINNGKTIIFTKGNNKLDEVIYGIYGRDITASLVEVGIPDNDVRGAADEIKITGYIAKPVVTRSNRAMEHYFVNGRYIRNNIVSKAIEEAYAPYMMQHRYPFTVLNISIDAEKIDVNVHPSKQEIRFEQPQDVFNSVYAVISKVLRKALMIPDSGDDTRDSQKEARERLLNDKSVQNAAEPFEKSAEDRRNIGSFDFVRESSQERASNGSAPICEGMKGGDPNGDRNGVPNPIGSLTGNGLSGRDQNGAVSLVGEGRTAFNTNSTVHFVGEGLPDADTTGGVPFVGESIVNRSGSVPGTIGGVQLDGASSPDGDGFANITTSQMRFTFDKDEKNAINGFRPETSEEFRKGMEAGYRIIGQVFATYWIVEKGDKMYMIDQHAAHEKIIYERICAHNADTVFDTQMLSPSMILSFTPPECACIEEHIEDFRNMGFELEHFSGSEYHLSGIPLMSYSLDPKELVHEIVDSYINVNTGNPGTMLKNVSHSATLKDRLATCSCKAAVKGNTKISFEEAKTIIEDLLKLENPFNCPHGRPVIIEMTKTELEKKFKRIV